MLIVFYLIPGLAVVGMGNSAGAFKTREQRLGVFLFWLPLLPVALIWAAIWVVRYIVVDGGDIQA